MDSRLLIDSIVRQTTVLIAQLSTAAGVRAPLSHIADQIFLQLSQEIEAHGVGRKVAADMFGLALRTYQRKVQRLTENSQLRDRTLWEAVLEFLEQGPTTRDRLRERFRYDGEEDLGAVLNDLVSNGLLYGTGRGDGAVFGLASNQDRQTMEEHQHLEALGSMLWQHVFARGAVQRDELVQEFPAQKSLLDAAVDWLLRDGRLSVTDTGALVASNFLLPVGSTRGWEAAVFDHFSAVAQAIAAKVQARARSASDDVTGGATLTFTIHPEHPEHDAVLSLLARLRRELDELWQRVSQHNQTHPIPWERAQQVRFYFGQHVRPSNSPDAATTDSAATSNPEVHA